MKLTKNLVSLDEAKQISEDYVAFVNGDFSKFDKIDEVFSKLKRGQKVLTHSGKQFVEAKVTSVNHNDFRAIDGPVVRVSNGEYSWRVDGCSYAYPIEG